MAVSIQSHAIKYKDPTTGEYQNIVGISGPQGPQGIQGIQGPQGVPGDEYTVMVQETQPTEESNKLWIPQEETEMTIPSYAEYQTYVEEVADLSSAFNDLENHVDTPEYKQSVADLVEGEFVQDVQVNGTSIVQDGVAEIPLGDENKYGVYQLGASSNGLYLFQNKLTVYPASETLVKNGSASFTPITPLHQHSSTFYGLAKAAGSNEKNSTLPVGQYTENAKSAISEMLNGSVSVEGTTPTINALPGIQYVCSEVSTLDITLPASGCIDVTFVSGSTPTVLTVTAPTGKTLSWTGDFDPTALEADTTYEINVAVVGDKCLGVAAAWT